MTVTVAEILAFAERLSCGDTEMEWRDATGRAYYAAYHGALASADLCPDNGHFRLGSHERLHDRFDAHGTKGAKSISVVLQTMKRYRHSADYDIADAFEKTVATNQVENCKRLVDRLRSFEELNRAA